MEWARILAFITRTVDQDLLLRNEHLAAENRILRGQLKGSPKLSNSERAKLGEIGHRLGRKTQEKGTHPQKADFDGLVGRSVPTTIQICDHLAVPFAINFPNPSPGTPRHPLQLPVTF
jgi:hypothetical protein